MFTSWSKGVEVERREVGLVEGGELGRKVKEREGRRRVDCLGVGGRKEGVV